YKPTSEGRRRRKTLIKGVTKARPEKRLTKPLKGPAGRNSGKVSSRHRQRGHKKFYRVIDFKRDKYDIPATVTALEHDPNRGPTIALVCYADGEKRYILAPEGLKVGDKVLSSRSFVETSPGNATILKHIPLSAQVHNIEINQGAGGQLIRGAGNYGTIMAKEGNYVNIKLPSGEVKRFLQDCLASIGVLSNTDLRNRVLGKAGVARHLGKRPHIRGVAIANPHDHPHGGSYKDKGIGGPSPKSPWGWKTRGKKTRSRKAGLKYLVSPRKGK
ncbi:MAG: 50S ribosomal protein L2, partial [bacterium]